MMPYLDHARRLGTRLVLDMAAAVAMAQGGETAQFQLQQMQLDLMDEDEREAYFAANRADLEARGGA